MTVSVEIFSELQQLVEVIFSSSSSFFPRDSPAFPVTPILPRISASWRLFFYSPIALSNLISLRSRIRCKKYIIEM